MTVPISISTVSVLSDIRFSTLATAPYADIDLNTDDFVVIQLHPSITLKIDPL